VVIVNHSSYSFATASLSELATTYSGPNPQTGGGGPEISGGFDPVVNPAILGMAWSWGSFYPPNHGDWQLQIFPTATTVLPVRFTWNGTTVKIDVYNGDIRPR
jgi:hypothetical protein